MLSVGIIGLPNVGKSTLFNSLSSGQANVSNYPFTTIDKNVGVVAVADERLEKLNGILHPKQCTPCSIQFIDIAGLVQGASQGEGLGNQFLGHIRDVDALFHVVRCFSEADVAHVFEDANPLRDIELVETEMVLADLDLLSTTQEKRGRVWKTNPREFAKEQERFSLYWETLEAGTPLRTLPLTQAERRELKTAGLLTGKPVLYVANLSEKDYTEDSALVQNLREGVRQPAEVATTSAKIEWELQQLDPEEREEFMRELQITEMSPPRLIRKAYQLLELITFYTIAHEKLQAWELEKGTRAPQAAGKIHSDMERNFIRAQVVSFESVCQHPSLQQLQDLGLVRREGKDYEVKDGDVIQFLFTS